MNKCIKTAFALFAFALLMPACDVVDEPYLEGAADEKAILSFNVDDIVGFIDEPSKTVTLNFPEGSDVTHLTPTITVSTYATIEPASGVAQDFSEPVYYTVTAFNGSTVRYEVSAVVQDPDNEKRILSFYIDGTAYDGIIDETAKTIRLEFPAGFDVTNLVPIIEVTEGASINPASGVAQDFSSPVEYTVTAKNGTTAVYTVSAIVGSDLLECYGKTVLIKDFTGARCVNCPAAADYVHNLQHQLDEDHIFILSVHAGYQAQPIGQFPNFLTDEGTAWYNNSDSNPLFAVDHVALTEGNSYTVEQIDAPVRDGLAESQSFEIVIDNDYDADSRQLEVSTRVIALADGEGDFFVTVCLVEDNILGWQIVPGGIDKEYVFRNVFRGTLNGVEGEIIADGSVQEEQQFFLRHTTTLNADFNADQCYVLAYVHDKTQGNKILQTMMKKIN